MSARLVRSARALGAAQVGIGAVMVVAPRFAAGLTGGPVPPTPIVRVLGAREIGQGAGTAIRPDATTLTLGAAVDMAHLASMVGLAVISPRWRRAAIGSAVVAAGSAVVGLALARADATT